MCAHVHTCTHVCTHMHTRVVSDISKASLPQELLAAASYTGSGIRKGRPLGGDFIQNGITRFSGIFIFKTPVFLTLTRWAPHQLLNAS